MPMSHMSHAYLKYVPSPQEPFCVDRKTNAKLSTVKYVIKFMGRANPITNFEFVEGYVKNNKPNKYLIFI